MKFKIQSKEQPKTLNDGIGLTELSRCKSVLELFIAQQKQCKNILFFSGPKGSLSHIKEFNGCVAELESMKEETNKCLELSKNLYK